MGQEEHATYEDALNARVAWMRSHGVVRWSGDLLFYDGACEAGPHRLVRTGLALGPAPRTPTAGELAYAESMKAPPEPLSEKDRELMARRAKYKRELGYVPTDEHLARLP